MQHDFESTVASSGQRCAAELTTVGNVPKMAYRCAPHITFEPHLFGDAPAQISISTSTLVPFNFLRFTRPVVCVLAYTFSAMRVHDGLLWDEPDSTSFSSSSIKRTGRRGASVYDSSTVGSRAHDILHKQQLDHSYRPSTIVVLIT